MNPVRIILTALTVSGLMAGCGKGPDAVAVSVDVNGWPAGREYTVNFDNTDTLSVYELSVFILHDRFLSRDSDTLQLTVTTVTPDTLTFSETITFHPRHAADMETPQYLETRQKYRSGVRFSHQGGYSFGFSHDKDAGLEGVRAIGMEIRPGRDN